MLHDLNHLPTRGPADDGIVARRGAKAVRFGEFRAEVAAWRQAFADAPGQRFALFFDDSLHCAAALYGAWHAGKTAYLPGDALPATVANLRAVVDGFAGDFSDVPLLAPLAPVPSALQDWSPLDPAAELLVIYTSGSTAAPSAIPKQLGQLFREVDALEQAFGARVGAADVLATVSHQHIYGLLFCVLWPLASGRVLHAQRHAFVERLPLGVPAVLIASPAHLKRLPALDLSALSAVFSSGGPLPDEALPDCLRAFGHAPIEVYGSSETGGVAWRQRSTTADTGWTALPGVDWRLSDDLLEIRSPHLPTRDWTPTADRAAAQGDNFVLLGRADRVVKIEEKRVSLAAVEAALLASPWLAALRVVPVTEVRQQLAVVAVPNAAGWALHDQIGKRAFGDRLRALLLQQLEPASAPRRWRFVSALPSNAQGKATQAALLALFDPRRPQPRVLSATPTSAQLRLTADAALPQFDGHFPQHPVLPGVAQLEWAILLGRELFALPPRFLGLEGLKFQQVIVPGERLTLALDFNPEVGKLSFKYSSERGQHASGRVLFGAAP